MAKKPKVVLRKKEVAKLLRRQDVEALLAKAGSRMAAKAGPGFKSSTYQGHDRVRGIVRSTTRAARKAEAENRALSRSVDAGKP